MRLGVRLVLVVRCYVAGGASRLLTNLRLPSACGALATPRQRMGVIRLGGVFLKENRAVINMELVPSLALFN